MPVATSEVSSQHHGSYGYGVGVGCTGERGREGNEKSQWTRSRFGTTGPDRHRYLHIHPTDFSYPSRKMLTNEREANRVPIHSRSFIIMIASARTTSTTR